MSENVHESGFSINHYIENAGEIHIANQLNGQQMQELFEGLVNKAEEYRNRWKLSESRGNGMKNMIAKQWQEISQLRDKLDQTEKKLKLAESTAEDYAQKYGRLYNKLKKVILESAADDAANKDK